MAVAASVWLGGVRRAASLRMCGDPVTTALPVIWDTDWYTDIDDPVALRLLLDHERDGRASIEAIVLDTRESIIPRSLDAFLNWHGRPGMPLGVVPVGFDPNRPDAVGAWHTGMITSGGTAITDGLTLPSSTTVYRQTLAAATTKVDIIAVGHLTALHALLLSPGDGIDARTGLQLVTDKVRHLWVMGGTYPSGTEHNFSVTTQAATSAQYVTANWPTTVPVTFAGFEVGNTVLTGGNLQTQAASDDILRQGLESYGTPNGRASWDPMQTHLAVLGDPAAAGYTTVQGTVVVAANGSNTFTADAAGPHRYVVKAKSDADFVAELNPLLVWTPYTSRAGEVVNVHASSFDAVADGVAVSSWDNPAGKELVQATGSLQPVVATIGGVKAVQFDGTKRLLSSATYPWGTEFTFYARVWWAATPAEQVVLAVGGSTSSSNSRSVWMRSESTGKLGAVAFTAGGSTGKVDTAAATITGGAWHNLVVRVSNTHLEAILDGATDGALAMGDNVDALTQFLTMGSRIHDGQQTPFSGYIRAARVYTVRHDDATVAAISAELV